MSVKAGRYLHYKGGEYEVLSTARHSETLEEMVVYKALYGEGQLWVRPAHSGTSRSRLTDNLSNASPISDKKRITKA